MSADAVPPWQIAVDFGTTMTVAAVSVDGGPGSVLQLERNSNRMPSAVFLEKDGGLAVGSRALHQAANDPSRFQATPKREVGRPFASLGDQRVPVTDVIAAVLAHVLLEAFRQRGARPPATVTLTHPARWGPSKTRVLAGVLAAAAKLLPALLRTAGLPEPVAAAAAALPEPRLIPEPVAAAWHYAQSYDLPAGRALAVYDLGGGTFDTAVLVRRADGGFDVAADGGAADLGGEEFDAALFTFCGARLAASRPGRWAAILDPGTDYDAWADRRRLLGYVQLAKEDLSTSMRTRCRLIDNPLEETLLTREELEQVIEPDLARSVAELKATIGRAGLRPGQLAGVYLVGGSSRIPEVARLVRAWAGLEPTPLDDPKAVVALGALLAARSVPGTANRDDVPPAPGPDPAPQLRAELAREVNLPEPDTRVLFAADLTRALAVRREYVTVIDLPGGQQRRIRGRLGMQIFGAALSRDGRQVATGSKAGWTWDAGTGQRLRKFSFGGGLNEGLGKDVTRLIFSSDGGLLAGYRERWQVWDTATGAALPSPPGSVSGFSPDGRMLIGRAGGLFKIWDAASGLQLREFRLGHTRGDQAELVAHDARMLVILTRRGVQAVDVATGRELLSFPLDEKRLWWSAALSPDSSMLAIASDHGIDHRIRKVVVWDVARAEIVLRLSHPVGTRGSPLVAFSPSGRWLAIVTDADVGIWDVSTGQLMSAISRPGVRRLRFGLDDRVLATGTGSDLQLWQLVG